MYTPAYQPQLGVEPQQSPNTPDDSYHPHKSKNKFIPSRQSPVNQFIDMQPISPHSGNSTLHVASLIPLSSEKSSKAGYN